MVRLRSYWIFAIFGAIGLIASLIMISFPKNSVFALVLAAPYLAIMVPLVITEICRSTPVFVRSLKWYHWAWALIFVSSLTFRISDVQSIAQNPIDAAAIFRLALEFLTFITLATRLALRKSEWVQSLFTGLVGFLAAYALMCLASTVWSAFPAWTLYKSLEYLLDVILLAAVVASISTVESYKDLFDLTWILYGLAVISVWVGVVLLSEFALKPIPGVLHFEIKGAMPNIAADSVGEFGAILAAVAFARIILKRRGLHERVWYS